MSGTGIWGTEDTRWLRSALKVVEAAKNSDTVLAPDVEEALEQFEEETR